MFSIKGTSMEEIQMSRRASAIDAENDKVSSARQPVTVECKNWEELDVGIEAPLMKLRSASNCSMRRRAPQTAPKKGITESPSSTAALEPLDIGY
jgi:hypothetical protein